MQQDREYILTQPMGKLFLRMAIPAIIGTVVMGLYNFVDAIFLGQFIGPIAVGAVGLLFTLYQSFQVRNTVWQRIERCI